MRQLTLDGRSLTLVHLKAVLAGEPVQLAIAKPAMAAVKRARAIVEAHVKNGDVVYGLTTGFGKLKSVAIAKEDLAQLQENLVLSHCVGVGEPLPPNIVRAAQVLRLNGLVRGHSGVSTTLVEHLVTCFNAGFVPVVPSQGSVGASGDLAPLAHMAAAYLGHGDCTVGGVRMKAALGLKKLKLKPIVLGAKEGLALINGTEIIKAIGAEAVLRAETVVASGDIVAALTLEALLGSLTPYADRIADLKGHQGHRDTASNVRRMLKNSEVLKSHAECDRVQDPYSLRCVPQIHGAVKTALAHVREVLALELNSVTDNPLVFPEDGSVVSAGQFHGQPLSIPLDYLAAALTTLGNVSERRIEQLVNPDLSRLPAFLTPQPGLNSGMMIVQVAAASLASENKSLAHPASVDTIPTSANQEDHVSMGPIAARKALQIARHVETIVAMEWLCAAQAREFHPELRAGDGAEAAHALLRSKVDALIGDRWLHDDIEAARAMVASGALRSAVEGAVGALRV